MKKITADKDDGIAEIIERMLGEGDGDAVIVLPKGAAIGRSVANFHLLKREADAAGKTVAIESVDENILAFAKESGLDANHPLWRGVRGAAGGVSDIIPSDGEGIDLGAAASERAKARVGAKRHVPAPKAAAGRAKTEPTKLVVRDESDESEEDEDVEVERSGYDGALASGDDEKARFEEGENRFFRRRTAAETADMEDDDGGDEYGEGGRSGGRKLAFWGAGIAAAVLVALGVVTFAFGHATVAITFVKTPWNYQGNFVADKSASAADPANGVIPAQVFSADKNATELFPASGSANVSIKAQGTITIYNDYGAKPQELVAKTRFLTPDGKLFRLTQTVTVPGAAVSGGTVTPSSITATVAADQPGPGYNVGPVQKLTIPGLQGSPEYGGFYGALLNGASGGATGVRPVPTAADIASAKAKMQSILESALTTDIAASYPNNFKILDGATQVAVQKLTVNTTTDSNGNFSVFGEATLEAIGFNEAAFKSALLMLAQSTEASSTWASIDITYGNVQLDFTKGTLGFSASAQGSLEPAFSPSDFAASVAGKSVGAARLDVAGIPQLASGKISVWPMWLWSMPSNPSKIDVSSE